MRIRSIKPGLESRFMLAHLPRLVYAGPLGPRKAWNRWDSEFCGPEEQAIYHLFNEAGAPVYFGKAWCPLYRFEKHQRRKWWPEVTHLNLYKVGCYEHPLERCGDLTRVALFWERAAIEDVRPLYNVAGVQRGGA